MATKKKKIIDPVKILPSGKVSVKFGNVALAEFLNALTHYLDIRFYYSPTGSSKLTDVVLFELYTGRLAGAVAIRAITLRRSEAIALREVWKKSDLFRANALNVVLMKLDQKLG
jgi:hypothetical protein